MVFQLFNLFPHLTAMENVTLAQKVVRRRSEDEAKEIALETARTGRHHAKKRMYILAIYPAVSSSALRSPGRWQ